jgi:hypothetical protein
MSFMNNEDDYLALIDSGAQLNLISENLARKMTHHELKVNVHTLQGIDDSRVGIKKWIAAPITLTNGTRVEVPFAVVRAIRAAIILGLPFLKAIQAQVNHAKPGEDLSRYGKADRLQQTCGRSRL